VNRDVSSWRALREQPPWRRPAATTVPAMGGPPRAAGCGGESTLAGSMHDEHPGWDVIASRDAGRRSGG
jgi:hypothetical protein